MAEYLEWCAFDRLAPIDADARQDVRFALLNQSVFAAQGVKTKTEDFIPQWDVERKTPSPQEVEAKFKLFAQFHNRAGKLRREKLNRKTGQKG